MTSDFSNSGSTPFGSRATDELAQGRPFGSRATDELAQGRRVAGRLTNERGMTIIETTVILSVLFILAGVMSPIVSESITTARAVKAKSDASMIAMGLINFQKDLGADALSIGGAATAAQTLGLADVLATEGTQPSVEDAESGVSIAAFDLLARPGGGTGDGRGDSNRAQRRKWLDMSTGALDDHLLTNRRGYRFRRPGEYGGWNGPYLSAEIKGDPWGNQFLINAVWLDGGGSATDRLGNRRRAVFVVSAGTNGIIETPFDQPITEARAFGDDIVMRIQ
jgi:type II secretory pathway pseudopilin PulG